MKKAYVIKRRGLFKCDAVEPFKVSRSQIEAFVECPRCFWLNHRLGMRRPSSPPFLINTLADRMLKKEFDEHRNAGTRHPVTVEHGLDVVPFQHPSIDDWRNNFKGVTHLHDRTNLLITGALDDIWQMRRWRKCDRKLIVVDYKATAKNGEVTLDDEWKVSYKRQIEVYQWLLRKQGLEVDDRGYFLYANGVDADGFETHFDASTMIVHGKLAFKISLLPYVGNTDWIEPTLRDLKRCLISPTAPEAPHDCEFCGYIEARRHEASFGDLSNAA